MNDHNIKKYLFDLNNFDEPHDHEEEEEVPPPPTVTLLEEEYEATLKSTYEEGFKAGVTQGNAETLESIEQKVMLDIKALLGQIDVFAQAEAERNRVFEVEAVRMQVSLLNKLYPLIEKKYGEQQLTDFVLSKLSTLPEGKNNIEIAVHSDRLETIKQKIEEMVAQRDAPNLMLSFKASNNMAETEIEIRWDNGGAKRFFERTKEQIEKNIANILAGKENLALNVQEETGEQESDQEFGRVEEAVIPEDTQADKALEKQDDTQ